MPSPPLRGRRPRSPAPAPCIFPGCLTAAAAFETAVKTSSTDASAWLDGSIAWADAGRPDQAVAWARRAAALSRIRERARLWAGASARREAIEADAVFTGILAREPDAAWAVLARAGRSWRWDAPPRPSPCSSAPRPSPCSRRWRISISAAPKRSWEIRPPPRGLPPRVSSDSYFHEGRDPLTRAYIRQKRYNDAWRQLTRLAEAEPSGRLTRVLMNKVRPLLTASSEPRPAPPQPTALAGPATDSETKGGIPFVRVGLGTTALGNPRPRVSVTVRGSSPWHAFDPRPGSRSRPSARRKRGR